MIPNAKALLHKSYMAYLFGEMQSLAKCEFRMHDSYDSTYRYYNSSRCSLSEKQKATPSESGIFRRLRLIGLTHLNEKNNRKILKTLYLHNMKKKKNTF